MDLKVLCTFPLSFLNGHCFSLLFSKSPLDVSPKTGPLDNPLLSSTGSSAQPTVSILDQRTRLWGLSCALQRAWSSISGLLPQYLLIEECGAVFRVSSHDRRWCYSVAQSCPTLCDPQGPQHARLPCPWPSPRVWSNSCPLNQWCHPTMIKLQTNMWGTQISLHFDHSVTRHSHFFCGFHHSQE